MSNEILVTYASRTGWTVGVTEAIGKTLAENGMQVDVDPMSQAKDISAYRAVVAGRAVNGGAWLPEAVQFIQSHQADLKRNPFASFLVGTTVAMPNAGQYGNHVAAWLDPVRKLVKPVSEGLFAGGLDVGKVASFGVSVKPFQITRG